MGLSGAVSLNIPGVSSVMDKIDALKAKFLAVPANVRFALDKLSRVRLTMSKGREITVAESGAILTVENNLKHTQAQWDTAAASFSRLDDLRRGQSSVSMDTILVASQLLTSAGYVIKNADANIAAVDAIANRYLTAEQRAALGIEKSGASGGSGVSAVTLAALGVGAFLFFRNRR